MTCKICSKDINGRFLCLSGGALLMDRETDSGGSDENMDAFLSITTHDDNNNLYETNDIIPINNGTSDGQFEIYFCSKKCIKQFFNDHVDKCSDIE